MACSHGSIISRLYQFSTFGCLTHKGPSKVALNINFSAFGWLARTGPALAAFINFWPLDVLPARVHQRLHLSLISHLRLLALHGSAFDDLFDYEDGGHVVIVTNLNENTYDLNMKVDFKRSNILALPLIWRRCWQLEGEGHVPVATNLKEDIMWPLPLTWKKPALPTWKRRPCTITTSIKNEIILSFPLWEERYQLEGGG